MLFKSADGQTPLPLLLDEAKTIIKQLRRRFAVQCPILPPYLPLPLPPLTSERLDKGRAALKVLIASLQTSCQELFSMYEAYEQSRQRLQGAQERVTALEQQADRHGAASPSFTAKMEKARMELRCLLKAGTEEEIRLLRENIRKIVCQINDQITRAKNALHALETEQKLVTVPVVSVGREEKPDDEGPRTKLVWQYVGSEFGQVEVLEEELASRAKAPKEPLSPFEIDPGPIGLSFDEYLRRHQDDPVIMELLHAPPPRDAESDDGNQGKQGHNT